MKRANGSSPIGHSVAIGRHGAPRLARRVAILAGLCAYGAHAAMPDIEWEPTPFVFQPGASRKYIDFENGDDCGAGTREQPWQHHPWDRRATDRAAECAGIHTYCFKRGVVYRGSLLVRESGAQGNPIRLTADPNWGRGPACLWGSVGLAPLWRSADTLDIPYLSPELKRRIWYAELGTNTPVRMLWMRRDGQATRLVPARAPNWEIENPDDPRQGWWEWASCFFRMRMTLDAVQGFAVGDQITGSGIWEDADEQRFNLDSSRTRVIGVERNTLLVTCAGWKRGEFKRGEQIANGRAVAKVLDMANVDGYWIADPAHLVQPQAAYWAGGTLWRERHPGIWPAPAPVLAYDPARHALASEGSRNDMWPCGRYYVSGLPHLLDVPGEFHYYAHGPYAGKLLVRLPGDADPNAAELELGRETVLIDIRDRRHIEIAGLDMRYLTFTAEDGADERACVHMRGACSHIAVRNCLMRDATGGVLATTEKKKQLMDGITVDSCDFANLTSSAVHVADRTRIGAAVGILNHVRVARNRAVNISYLRSTHAIEVSGGMAVDVHHNVTDTTYGAGILVFGGRDYRMLDIDRPFVRIQIHHNRVENSLLARQDYGGIACWQLGPAYIYNNISGNAVGYKHMDHRLNRRRDWYRTSCYGPGIYLDGQYKSYVFNNVVWGRNNNVNDRVYNAAAFNEAMGFLNTVFQNTFYNCGVGLHKGMRQHNRGYYVGNLFLDCGRRHIQQEPTEAGIERDSLGYAGNVFAGAPPDFGQLGAHSYKTLADWQQAMRQDKLIAWETGTLAAGEQVADARGHEFTPRPDATAVDRGARVFVPWALARVVGEWNFLKHPADPGLILGEHVNYGEEWYFRSMFQLIPRHNLEAHGVGLADFQPGLLEDWVEGALHLNGRDQYAAITEAELKQDVPWQCGAPRYVPRHEGVLEGRKRPTVDMDTNNFLIEIVFRTDGPARAAGLVAKCDATRGYALDLDEHGFLRLRLAFGGGSCARQSAGPVADGKWHHVLAEVDRDRPEGIALYVDGQPANGAWEGRMDGAASLACPADFTVGKLPRGALAPADCYFAGWVDFLRVARGTLADAETTIGELHAWEFDGPHLKDFGGRPAAGRARDAGAVELVGAGGR
ncbi:MAG: hypothetical protein JXR37_32340 [Kiritimatiellae bacterium]|nr:hypothetical protein [Kiritimatiellia bacterium]